MVLGVSIHTGPVDSVNRFLCVLVVEKVYKTGLADKLTGTDGSALDTR